MRKIVGVVLLAMLAGCAGFDLGELPPEPIAFVQRTSEQGERRAELLRSRDEDEGEGATGTKGVFRMRDVIDFLSGAEPPKVLLETYGRMSLLDPKTLGVTPLPVARPGSRPLEWSRDHRRLRFMAMQRERPQVLEYDVQSGEVRLVTTGREAEAYASVSPQNRIAFSRATGTGEKMSSRIFVRDEGGAERAVSLGPNDFRPVWSPDGRTLLFSTITAGDVPAIARVEADLTAPAKLVARGRDPVFTSDGAWVVYAQQHRGQWRLWRMRPDGSGKGAIGAPGTAETYDEVRPAVSSDGRFVVYVSLENERERLRIRRFDGSGDRPLLEAGDASDPVW